MDRQMGHEPDGQRVVFSNIHTMSWAWVWLTAPEPIPLQIKEQIDTQVCQI